MDVQGDTVFDIVLFQSLITVSDKYSSVLEKIKIFWENVRDAENAKKSRERVHFRLVLISILTTK